MFNNSSRYTPLAALILLLVAGCGKTPNEPESLIVDLTLPWVEANPADVGMDAGILEQAVAAAETILRWRSLVVIRDGQLVLEHYHELISPDSLLDVRSVTKSITSTLLGLALERGDIASLDDSFTDYLTNLAFEDAAKGAITLRQMLTMSSGLFWNEFTGTSYSDWIQSDNKSIYVISQELVNTPGSQFMYNTGTTYLLGRVVAAATGMNLQTFAETHLFSKIGIERVQWAVFPDGTVNAGAGIDLSTRDLARLGQLFLQQGISGDVQVVPESWVTEATSAKFSWRTTAGPFTAVSYGYQWWTNESATDRAFFAWGYGGQFVFVVPDQQLVVVTTTRWQRLNSADASSLAYQVLTDVIGKVLDAL